MSENTFPAYLRKFEIVIFIFQMDESMQPLRPYERFDTLRQFLDHDRHVLRFFCFWDDTDSLYGDPRDLVLHYFLGKIRAYSL